jgi:hypothetical protein
MTGTLVKIIPTVLNTCSKLSEVDSDAYAASFCLLQNKPLQSAWITARILYTPVTWNSIQLWGSNELRGTHEELEEEDDELLLDDDDELAI